MIEKTRKLSLGWFVSNHPLGKKALWWTNGTLSSPDQILNRLWLLEKSKFK